MEANSMSVEEILAQFDKTQPTPPAQQTTVKVPDNTVGVKLDQVVTPVDNNLSVDDIINGTEDITNQDPAQTEPVQKGRPPKENLTKTDLNTIKILIDSGQIQPWVDDKTNTVILPQTKEELIELMNQNIETISENNYRTVEDQFYTSKSPVWQALLQQSEKARSFDDVAPLFQKIQTYEAGVALDLENIEHQEEVIKQNGLIQGVPISAIMSDIADLKERGKLKERAEAIKPNLDKYNELQIQNDIIARENRERADAIAYQTHIDNVINRIIIPKDIAGIKFKDEHKQLIASTLIPDESIGGLPIYAIIDNLVKRGEFEHLAQIALLATDRKSYSNYFGNQVANQVASGLQKKLRDSNQSNSGSVVNDTFRTHEPRPIENAFL